MREIVLRTKIIQSILKNDNDFCITLKKLILFLN